MNIRNVQENAQGSSWHMANVITISMPSILGVGKGGKQQMFLAKEADM